MALDLSFLRIATETFNPYSPWSGTEHMAPLLYSLVRMVRPMTIVESGSGYTTLFLLRALADNSADVQEEARLLKEKTQSILPVLSDFESLDQECVARWFGAGGKACAADPAFYLTPYSPHLYSFEALGENHEYSQAVKKAVNEVGHASIFTYMHGEFVAEDLPAQIDLAWNDHHPYKEFFEICWPRLNENSGMLIFHNVPAHEELWDSIEWMKESRSVEKDMEVLILQEPHKLDQNGCAILRRTSAYRPPFALANPLSVFESLKDFQALRPAR